MLSPKVEICEIWMAQHIHPHTMVYDHSSSCVLQKHLLAINFSYLMNIRPWEYRTEAFSDLEWGMCCKPLEFKYRLLSLLSTLWAQCLRLNLLGLVNQQNETKSRILLNRGKSFSNGFEGPKKTRPFPCPFRVEANSILAKVKKLAMEAGPNTTRNPKGIGWDADVSRKWIKLKLKGKSFATIAR